MKKIILLFAIFALFSCVSTKELQLTIDNCNSEIKDQSDKIKGLEDKIDLLYKFLTLTKSNYTTEDNIIPSTANTEDKNVNRKSNQCKALTASGSKCSRNAQSGSEYCWQHALKNSNSESVSTNQKSNSTSTYKGSNEILTGSRGGKYYINSHGNKTYVKRK